MAGKAKSMHLTVCLKGSHTSVFYKMFFNAKELNDYIKTPEFMEKYPEDKFQIIKETY